MIILLAFFFPLAAYLLLLGFLNRGRHPLLVSGVWDGIGLLFGVSGFLLFAGPAILSAMSERWRWFWLLGKGGMSQAAAEGAQPMWLFLGSLYFVLIVGGAAHYLWRQRFLTTIYNANAGSVERTLTDICKELGANPVRSGSLFVFEISRHTDGGKWDLGIEARPLVRDPSRDVNEAVTPLLYGHGPDSTREQATLLEVDCFPLMSHVTLRWDPAASPLRRFVEAELSRRLSDTLLEDGLLGAWLLTAGFLLLAFDLVGAFFLILWNLQVFIR